MLFDEHASSALNDSVRALVLDRGSRHPPPARSPRSRQAGAPGRRTVAHRARSLAGSPRTAFATRPEPASPARDDHGAVLGDGAAARRARALFVGAAGPRIRGRPAARASAARRRSPSVSSTATRCATSTLERDGRRARGSDALVTMAVIPNPDPDRYGGAIVDGDVVTGFVPRGQWTVVAFRRRADRGARGLRGAAGRRRRGKRRQPYPALIAGTARQRPGVRHRGGVPRYRHASRLPGGASHCARGDLASGGRRARVGCRRARLEDCVVWDDVDIADGARLRRMHRDDGVQSRADCTAVGIMTGCART